MERDLSGIRHHGIVDEGVIGKTAQTSFVRYAMWAAAVLPSETTAFTDIRGSF